jgi:chemotaxis protein CheX
VVTVKSELVDGETDYEFIEKCFANAVMEVIRMSAGLDVCEHKENVEQDRTRTGLISGMMLLCGEKNAVLSITMTKAVASTLVAYMTGILPEDIEEEDLCDGAAELANMIAGRAKVDLVGTEYHFGITPPFSIEGEDYSIVYKNKMQRIYKKFASDDIEIFLQVAYI